MQEAELQTHLDAVAEDGFTILENVFSKDRADAFCKRVREIERDTLHPLETGETEADSSFYRTAGLLRMDPIFWDVPIGMPSSLEMARDSSSKATAFSLSPGPSRSLSVSA